MDAEAPPVDGYEALGAREVMRVLLGLDAGLLRRVYTWEERHRRRAHVLAAIRRALARTPPPP